MTTPSRKELAASLWTHNPDNQYGLSWEQLSKQTQKNYLAYADAVMPLIASSNDENWNQGFIDGVDAAQAMTDFTDETRTSIFDKEGITDNDN